MPNSKGKKSVYTDKISMSGRSAYTQKQLRNDTNLDTPLCIIDRVAVNGQLFTNRNMGKH